jgi:hypothetical protein
MRSKFAEAGRFDEHRWTSDGHWVKVGGDRNWRNNNPGNVESGRFATLHGAIGSDGRFAIFPDYRTGRAALISLLKTESYVGLSVAKAIERFAPRVENDTPAYTAFIQSRVGVTPDTLVSELSEDQLAAAAVAIEIFEGGREGVTYRIGDPHAPEMIARLGQMFRSKASVQSG